MKKLQTALAILGCVCAASVSRGGYDVNVDLKNVSGEAKENWPVVMKVYTVLGRDLDPASIRDDNFHVYGPDGKEAPYAIEENPPADQPGNDELIVVVPKIAAGQTLTYRITQTNVKSAFRQSVDLAASPHNLLPNGNFEKAEGDAVAHFTGGKRDAQVKRAGKASLVLSSDGGRVSARVDQPVRLHKESWYYFGCWSRTEGVSRFGYQAGNGAYFKFQYVTPPSTNAGTANFGSVMNQCSTRDWLKCTFEGGYTGWGVERYHTQAKADAATIEFILDQQRHYYMESGKTRGTWWLDQAVLLEQPEITVRFDQSLAPLMPDGVFLFTRPPSMPLGRLEEQVGGRVLPAPWKTTWCAYPFAHEKLTRLDKAAIRGQRVSYCIGVYHKKPIARAQCAGGTLARQADPSERPAPPANESAPALAPELIEYSPGYLGANPRRYLRILNKDPNAPEAVEMPDAEGIRYFFITYRVAGNVRPGRYAGTVRLALDGRITEIPVVLRVQDLDQPVLRDIYVGLIYNGGVPYGDELLQQYARSGFSQIMWFHRFLPYKKGDDGKMHVDGDALAPKMKQLLDLGITAGCGLYSDVQLDDKPKGHRGVMFGYAGGQKGEYARLLKELDACARAHPEWPKFIHMNWDEPQDADPKMGWTSEILGPDTLTTLDANFFPLAKTAKFYTIPAYDDPADWAGPEIYRWTKKTTKDFGFCGTADVDENARYQPGMLMIATGARYFHAWHLKGGHTAGQLDYDKERKEMQRAISMIAWGDGMNDLKAHRLLTDAIAGGRKSSDPRSLAAVKSAEEYQAGIGAVWNGDHRKTWMVQPYLGTAFQWGYERFYDDWQEQMLRHAAAIRGVPWVE